MNSIEDYGEYKVVSNSIGETFSVDKSMPDYIELCIDSLGDTIFIRFDKDSIIEQILK